MGHGSLNSAHGFGFGTRSPSPSNGSGSGFSESLVIVDATLSRRACGPPESPVTIALYSGKGDLAPMARVCEVCGRGPRFGHRISHAHNVSKRRWNLNLQSVHAIVQGAAKRIRVCTSCIRSGKIQKAA